MDVNRIVGEIDAEIKRLTDARAILLSGTAAKTGKGPGRPKGSKNAKVAASAAPRKRKLSSAGRKRISDAMKRRWEERRKQAGKSGATAK